MGLVITSFSGHSVYVEYADVIILVKRWQKKKFEKPKSFARYAREHPQSWFKFQKFVG